MLDAVDLRANLGDDSAPRARAVKLFLDSYPDVLQAAWAAAARGDRAALRESAHRLAGAIGNFPAPAAWAPARRLEKIARGGELGESLAACAALDAELERLVPTLRELLGEIVGRSEGSSLAPTA